MSLEDKLYPLLRLYEAAPQPVKSLAGHVYRTLPVAWRQGQAYPKFQQEARDCESWDADTTRRYQVSHVRESLIAAGKAPFYARRFAEAGVKPEQFESLEQLSAYPLLTKADLHQHREEMVNPEIPASQRLYITTGGSSGVPVGFYLQRGVSRPKEQAFLEAQWSRRGYRPGDRVAVIRGGVTSSRARGGISYYDATRDWLILSSYHLTLDRLPEYVAALQRFRPNHLHAYPSAALLLARSLEQTGMKLNFSLTSVLCGSEKLDAESQAYLERVFDARVFHWYGHSERVVLAGQGRHTDHLYFWPGYGYVEFGEADAQGCREIIGTSFHNHVMPLIRYRTGDYAKFSARMDGELPMTEIEAVVGRDYEFLVSATGRQISLTALNMHDSIFDGLLAVQFAQGKPGEVEFRYQPGPAWPPARAESMRAGLLRKLGDDFDLRLREVGEVEKTVSGKHRWLVKMA
ncbi:phenylacetate--CoA ligase family protein [Brevifollis gellanilyticus]|uniref:Capsular polysaccharide biosynthesis protein CapK n=1 Tax=Brevifollis gellanilyticus TaxID=748831 RepID=A0A512MCY5_9BACT|nr:phenylacetate--CoA ligase family protein [Brevifollis gellanilyticus]GEP44595.1 capsular polysaccharide biosynthesis protein CapK [Brevifollis gellanilyticus]